MGDTKAPATITEKIHYMESFLDLGQFINGDKNSAEQIRSYYRTNHGAYRRVHSKAGFMHFHVSKNGQFSPKDAYYQPDVAARYIKPGDHVLELGSGQGANAVYLAAKFPDATFIGLDLFPAKREDKLANLTIRQQDYSTMPDFADESFDVIYGIETLVHLTHKEPVLREIRRVLKPNGVFVVFDYALSRRFEEFTPETQTAIALISKGGNAAMIESVEEWETHFANAGFSVVEADDLTREIMPDLKRLQHKAAHIMDHKFRARVIFRMMPKQYVTNILLGWLGYDSAAEGANVYKEWILKKG